MTAASHISDLADFGSGATGGTTATLQDSNVEVKSKLHETNFLMECEIMYIRYRISNIVSGLEAEHGDGLSRGPRAATAEVPGGEERLLREDRQRRRQVFTLFSGPNLGLIRIIFADEGDLSPPKQGGTFLTEVEIPASGAETAAAASGADDVSDLLRDAQKVPSPVASSSAFALKLQQNKHDLSATFSALLMSGGRETKPDEVSHWRRPNAILLIGGGKSKLQTMKCIDKSKYLWCMPL